MHLRSVFRIITERILGSQDATFFFFVFFFLFFFCFVFFFVCFFFVHADNEDSDQAAQICMLT